MAVHRLPCIEVQKPRTCTVSLVGVMDHVDGAPLRQCHVQGIEHELGFKIMAHGPADDAPREGIQHNGQVQEPGPGRDIGDVGHPEPVWRIGVEIPVDQIASRPHPFVPEGRTGSFSAADASQAHRFHQAFDTLSADMDAVIDEFSVDTRRTIGLPGRLMDCLDSRSQLRIGNGSGRWNTPTPRIVTRS